MKESNKINKKSQDRAATRQAARALPPLPAAKHQRRRALCRADLAKFCTTYLAGRFPLAFSDDHLRVLAMLQRTVLAGDLFAVAMPRGSGKTTMCEAAVLWALLYGHRRFVLVVAADQVAAVNVVTSIRSELECNDLLAEDYPEACHPIRSLGGIARRAEGQVYEDGARTWLVWTKDEVRLPAQAAGGGSVVRSAGITGRIRGAKAGLADGSQVRPDLVLIDDPQTDESARSASQVEVRMQTLTKTILGLAGPGQRIACLATCTVIARGDVAEQLLDRKANPHWQGIKCTMLRSLPSRLDLWDEYAEILKTDLEAELGPQRATEFYRAHRSAMDAGAVASWPERYATGELSAIQHAMTLRIVRGADAWSAEYQNSPADPAAVSEADQITPAKVLRKITAIPRGTVPDEAIEITAGIDVGEHVLWWTVIAWGPGMSGDVLDYGPYPDPGRYITAREMRGALAKAHPADRIEDRWQAALDAMAARILDREWLRADGTPMRCSQVLVDAGYGTSTPTVYGWIGRHPSRDRILPSHGRGIRPGQASLSEWIKKPGDRVGQEWRIPGKRVRQSRHVLFDADYWKGVVARRILAAPGSGLSLPAGTHRLIADHWSAETRTPVTAEGQTRDRWSLRPNADNHLLDTTVLAAVAASIRGIGTDLPTAARSKAPATAGTATAKAATVAVQQRAAPPPTPYRQPGGWLKGF